MTFNLELSKHASAYVIVSFTSKLYTCDEYKGSIQFPFFFSFFFQNHRALVWGNDKTKEAVCE